MQIHFNVKQRINNSSNYCYRQSHQPGLPRGSQIVFAVLAYSIIALCFSLKNITVWISYMVTHDI